MINNCDRITDTANNAGICCFTFATERIND